MRYRDLLTELHHFSAASSLEGNTVLLFNDGNMFTGEDMEEVIDEFFDELKKYFPDAYEFPDDLADNIYDYADEPKTNNLIIAHIHNNSLTISNISEIHVDSVLYKEIQKAVKQLGLDGVAYEADDPVTGEDLSKFIPREKVINATIGNTLMYHGTSTKYLDKISKMGIAPTPKSNYNKINHPEMVFFTTKYNKAAYHAINASSDNHVPMVLGFKVPDQAKVVLDYDVAIQIYGIEHPKVQELGYDIVFDISGGSYEYLPEPIAVGDSITQELDLRSLNTRIGIFGYKGRIPATFIEFIEMDVYKYVFQDVFGDDYDSKHLEKFTSFKELKERITEIREILEDEDDY